MQWLLTFLPSHTSKDESLTFKLGFHALPSMSQLHMHVISEDFNSPSLKNKKHWNSFTSPFFVGTEEFISMLATKGHVEVDSRTLCQCTYFLWL